MASDTSTKSNGRHDVHAPFDLSVCVWKAPALREISFVMQRISSAVVCPAFDAAIYRLLALKGSARIVPPID